MPDPLRSRELMKASARLGVEGHGRRILRDMADARSLGDRLMSGSEDRLRTQSLSDARVLLLAFSAAHLSELRYHLRAIGVKVTAAAPTIKQLPNVTGMGRAFTHVLVNFDAYSDVESGVDRLCEFRKQSPGLVLVLCSAQVGGDDMGTERAAICDATLRLPVSMSRLRAGLIAASVNHCERKARQDQCRDH